MIIPYKTDVEYYDNPISNIVIVILSIICFFIPFFSESVFYLMILKGWNVVGLVGHIFLHANIFHLLGNMFMLWIFGNAICARYGNFKFILFYLITGVIGGSCHLLLSDQPIIGASGAINGVIGAFLILYPKNKVNIFIWFFSLFPPTTIKIPSIILILIWFIFDIVGAIGGIGNTAFVAHIGGLISGILITIIALKMNILSYDNPHSLTSNTIKEDKKRTGKINSIQKVKYSKVQSDDYFVVKCPYCDNPMKASNKFVGKRVKCPTCSSFFNL